MARTLSDSPHHINVLRETKRARRRGPALRLDWLIDQHHHSTVVGFGASQLKPPLTSFGKEALSFPQDQGSDRQHILINEVMLREQANQIGAAIHQENSTRL